MGFVYVEVVVHGKKASKPIRMLADTGSTYIALPSEIVGELGLVETPYSVSLTLGDKRKVEARLFLAEVEVGGRRGPAFVARLEVPVPLLGIYALETLGYKVNPRTGELEEISPEGGYLLNICLPPASKNSRLSNLSLEVLCWGRGNPQIHVGDIGKLRGTLPSDIEIYS